jgi:hypothetical protein
MKWLLTSFGIGANILTAYLTLMIGFKCQILMQILKVFWKASQAPSLVSFRLKLCFRKRVLKIYPSF